VDRLLEKGYKPEDITLEKIYPTGHGTSGRLDILVKNDKHAYLMIECKTWGSEFDKAFKKLQKDGGQLFTYFQQDTKAEYLMLYASHFDGNKVAYRNEIIKVEPHYKEAGNVKDFYDRWNKLSKSNGVFDDWVNAYEFQSKALTRKDLKIINQEDSGFIFNRFLEILRHNVVSDKPNAFNKLITLLLCKIVDEDRGENEELCFQWLETDTSINLQKRLNDLYKIGMDKYLTKIVTDYSDKDVEDIVGLNEAQKDTIKKMMTELRLKKNNEFAFKEVFNDQSFDENSKVLKEVVELLQPYQVRYNKKQQFLGDFFELLLNTSIKQEAGQFFTPVPIARFIINSIPIKSIITTKISNGEPDFLPYVIDYAVGSGHFLTEAMDEIHHIVSELNESADFKPSIKKSLAKWSEDYEWAYNFIYGIEKDYRLVKTAKVSCFLNGDGLARIFNADGLASFQNDVDYKDKLKISSKSDPKDNQEFDILIANPPYSVSAFKNTLVDGDKSFELYDRLTEESSEIECLFIERTKQLLKDGGYAGIVLPSSILNNSGIYSDAREILLKYFKIVAIAEFGSNTFMATGTNTVTLFLQRRNSADWRKIEHTITEFFINHTDVACNGVENPFSKYVKHIYETLSLKDYISLVTENPSEAMKKHGLFIDYQRAFNDQTAIKNLKKKPAFKAKSDIEQELELNKLFYSYVFGLEKEKLLYFILAYPQKTLLIKSNPDGKNDTEKEFLGYEFSNRRGHEGIKAYGATTIQEATKLYDDQNTLNPERVNSYIHKAFLGEKIEVSKNLQKHITELDLVDMITLDRVVFEKNISLSVKKKIKIDTKYPLVPLGNLIAVNYGERITIKNSSGTRYPVYGGGGETFRTENFNRNDCLIISRFGMSENCARFVSGKFFLNDSGFSVDILDENLNLKYLNNFLLTSQDQIYSCGRGLAQKNIDIDQFKKIKIPLPPKDVQEKIVSEIEKIESKEIQLTQRIEELRNQIVAKANKLYDTEPLKKILSVCNPPVYGANEKAVKGDRDKDFRYIRITDINEDGTLNDDWKTAEHVESKYILEDGDILFARSGATAGKTLIYKTAFGKAIYAGYLILFRPKEELLSDYFDLVLKSDVYKKWVLGKRKGTAQPNINAQDYGSFEIPIVSIPEQKKIVIEALKTNKEISNSRLELQELNKNRAKVLKKYL
jgi:type I restriction enzyme M protein